MKCLKCVYGIAWSDKLTDDYRPASQFLSDFWSILASFGCNFTVFWFTLILSI